MLMPREKVRLTAVRGTDPRSFHLQSVRGSDNMELYGRVYDVMNSSATSAEKDRQIEQLLRDNKSLLMSAFLVTYFENAFEQYAPLYKELRDALIGTYPKSDFVLHLDQRVRSVVMVGMEAPDIVMADSTGKARRLSDLRGKVVLIDFWASWCRPCRMENPNVVRLYGKYHDKGFEIFSVSLDKDYNSWVKAIETDNLSWPNHVSDLKYWSSAAGRLYGISSIPSTVLVDREGKVVARNLRGRELENKLEEIFNQ
jgi:peroxiredoxin